MNLESLENIAATPENMNRLVVVRQCPVGTVSAPIMDECTTKSCWPVPPLGEGDEGEKPMRLPMRPREDNGLNEIMSPTRNERKERPVPIHIHQTKDGIDEELAMGCLVLDKCNQISVPAPPIDDDALLLGGILPDEAEEQVSVVYHDDQSHRRTTRNTSKVGFNLVIEDDEPLPLTPTPTTRTTGKSRVNDGKFMDDDDEKTFRRNSRFMICIILMILLALFAVIGYLLKEFRAGKTIGFMRRSRSNAPLLPPSAPPTSSPMSAPPV